MVCRAEQINQARPAGGISSASSFCTTTPTGHFLENTMKKIPLTQGKFATVDDADFEWLNCYKWSAMRSRKTWYARRFVIGNCKQKKQVLMHRQIMNFPKNRQIDHRNGNGLSNQVFRLRIADHL